MKTASIWIVTLFLAMAFYPGISHHLVTITATPAVAADKALPSGTFVADNYIYRKLTCSGQIASERPNTYVFGIKDKSNGACTTRLYLANSPDEAYGCAKKTCPNCQIEDITWMYGYTSSAPGITNTDRYCPQLK